MIDIQNANSFLSAQGCIYPDNKSKFTNRQTIRKL